jgi:agmatinase
MIGKTGIFYQPMVRWEDADCVVIGLPWDGTVSGRPGSRFGPEAIRLATRNVEDYSPYLHRDISETKLHDIGDIELPFGSTNDTLTLIDSTCTPFITRKKKLVTLGGEHLGTWPIIKAMHQHYGDEIFVIQLDAHADLRSEYLGVHYSHATVMHLISELIGKENTAAVGIRSGTREEWKLLRSHPHFFGGLSSKSLSDFESFAHETLSSRRVYITLDCDVFDPGIFPGTGTPEPGGITFNDFIMIMKVLAEYDIIGADIVELAPDYDHSGISSALAATALRELILAGKRI